MPNFYDKLTEAVNDDTLTEDFNQLLQIATSPDSFKNTTELKEYIAEGALLNINTFGTRAFSIPSGEYMVWLTDAGHTMLVPTNTIAKSPEVYEHTQETYELSTRDMLKKFNCFTKTLAESWNEAEDDDDEYQTDAEKDDEKDSEYVKRAESQGKFSLAVDKNTVDRTPIMKAMEEKQLTVTRLAELCGVDTPAISRILRTPETGPGDPGGRNPSIELAAQICAALSMDPRSAFPDIFSKKPSTKKEGTP